MSLIRDKDTTVLFVDTTVNPFVAIRGITFVFTSLDNTSCNTLAEYNMKLISRNWIISDVEKKFVVAGILRFLWVELIERTLEACVTYIYADMGSYGLHLFNPNSISYRIVNFTSK